MFATTAPAALPHGMTLAVLEHAAPAQMTISVVPEGLLGVSLCSRCGARAERIVAVPPVVQTMGDDSAVLNFLSPLVEHFDAWGEAHTTCSHGRLDERAPVIAEVVEELLADARRMLAAEVALAPLAAVLLENGEVLLMPVDGFPPARENPSARAAAIARAHASVRRHLLSRGTRAEATILVTEGWTSGATNVAPTLAADRREVLLLAVTAREWSGMAVAPITRASGRAEHGPGMVGALEWRRPCPAPLLDGLLAEPVYEAN